MLNYKRYYLRSNSYDYLALNKVLRTNDAKIWVFARNREKTAGGILLHPVTVSEVTPLRM